MIEIIILLIKKLYKKKIIYLIIHKKFNQKIFKRQMKEMRYISKIIINMLIHLKDQIKMLKIL